MGRGKQYKKKKGLVGVCTGWLSVVSASASVILIFSGMYDQGFRIGLVLDVSVYGGGEFEGCGEYGEYGADGGYRMVYARMIYV